ncbi:MAG: transglutaminase family protein, partial [Phycisphaerales bacterium]|nr:transglutaminase family protein [Phycisphaerales bacterium]
MGIRVALHHRTQYSYDRLVSLSPQVVRLRPAPHSRTPVTAYSLKISPEDHFINWQLDPYSNYLARLVFHKATEQFTVEVDLVADMTVINPFDFFMEEYAEKYPFAYEPTLARELTPYLEKLPRGPRMSRLVAELRENCMQPGMRSIDFVVGVNQRINNLLAYIIRMEPGVQTPEETLELGKGSCRDFAWLMVNVLRH